MYTTTNYDGTETTYPVTYELTIKNPCVNKDFVTINAPTLSKETYTIDSGSKTFDAHTPFTVVSTPAGSHELCGDLSIVAKFDGVNVDGDPLSYDKD